MVLLVTNTKDATADYLCSSLQANGMGHLRFDTDQYLSRYKVSYKSSNDSESFVLRDEISRNELCSREVTGVWYRRPVAPELSIDEEPPEISSQLSIEARVQYESVIATVPTRNWISAPDRIFVSENRLLQLRVARECGLSIPSTIIANSSQEMMQFIETHDRCCTKPLFSGQFNTREGLKLFYTTIVDKNDTKFVAAVRNFPVLVQEYVDKQYELRLIVVGRSIFPVKIYSQDDTRTATDWRVENCTIPRYEATEVPNELLAAARRIVSRFGLQFSSMDIIVTQNGGYYFLDLNPNGQWAWLDSMLHLGVSSTLANMLVGE